MKCINLTDRLKYESKQKESSHFAIKDSTDYCLDVCPRKQVCDFYKRYPTYQTKQETEPMFVGSRL